MKQAIKQYHPRPQLKREKWYSLDGEWNLNGQTVRVPFCPQSELSGFTGEVPDELEYEKRFLLPDNFDQKRILLHFGAADQIAEVSLNGHKLGTHEGGYLPFTFDITKTVWHDCENVLKVKVTDGLSHDLPYGKQRKDHGGMWYTPVSGIWQSVWIENVPEKYIEELKLTPDLNGVMIEVLGAGTFSVEVTLPDKTVKTACFEGSKGYLKIDAPIRWTPEDPHLYPLTVICGEDKLESYFALRTVEIKEICGVNRVCLNGKPIFLHGVLDQGYFSDGIYTPKHPSEYEQDILRMKELGFNLLRKHIKIEPECFYESCDRLGMLVMQDMVNNGDYHFIRDTAFPTVGLKKHDDTKGKGDTRRKEIFTQHMLQTAKTLYSHPCIIAYTVFNEGWGQFDSDRHYALLKKADPTRLVDSTSGWFWQKESDFDSEHIYFRTPKLHPKKRPLFVTECGGYVLKVAGHQFDADKQYGYGSCKDSSDLTGRIENMYRKMIIPAIKNGLCGCIYTQLSDVEEEANGFYTYDRAVCKVDKGRMKRLSDELRAVLSDFDSENIKK